jgi:holo-[acyl-carrier protein] synthase
MIADFEELAGPPGGHRVRVGCDIVSVAEVEHAIDNFGDRYLRKVFTDNEIDDCAGLDRATRLAARFAAKEAVIKAFADGEQAFALGEIEVQKSGSVPRIALTGRLAELAERQGWVETSLSLSHADCHAMAVLLVRCSPESA